MTAIPLSERAISRRWQDNFVSVVPTVTNHAAIQFRRLRAEARADAQAEVLARACLDYRALAHAYPSTLANFAAKAFRGGRRVGGHMASRDVLSPLAQQKHHFVVGSLTPPCGIDGTWRDLLLESRRVSPADQAACNVDFAEWLKTFPRRHRAIIKAMASGCTTTELALRFRVSLGRISQLRAAYHQSWSTFQGENQPSLAA